MVPKEPLSIFQQARNLISFLFFFNHSDNIVWKTKKGGSVHSFIPEIYTLSVAMSWVLGYDGQCRCGPRLSFCPRIFSLFPVSPRSWPPQLLLCPLHNPLSPSLQPPGGSNRPTAPGSRVSAGDSKRFFLGREAASRLHRGQWVPLLLLPGPLQE